MTRPFVGESESSEFVGYILVQNFFEELRRLVPS